MLLNLESPLRLCRNIILDYPDELFKQLTLHEVILIAHMHDELGEWACLLNVHWFRLVKVNHLADLPVDEIKCFRDESVVAELYAEHGEFGLSNLEMAVACQIGRLNDRSPDRISHLIELGLGKFSKKEHVADESVLDLPLDAADPAERD